MQETPFRCNVERMEDKSGEIHIRGLALMYARCGIYEKALMTGLCAASGSLDLGKTSDVPRKIVRSDAHAQDSHVRNCGS
jgi:hypothetical protein